MTSVRRVLSEKRRLVAPLVIAGLASVLLYVVVVFPLGRQVSAAEQQAQAQRESVFRARADYQAAKAMVQGKELADASLKKFYQDVLPANSSVARRLTYLKLSQLAGAANVHLESGTNTYSHEKGSHLSKVTTTYTLSGDYRDVRRFIYSLETAPEFMVLENIGLTSLEQQQARSGLAVKLDVATYFRTEDVD
jgi:Type II secretion system (T2SS), protein M subtype b